MIPSPETAHILIVDDDQASRIMIRKFLEKRQYQAQEAESASQAMELMAANEFQLILMDIDMPDVDGIAACQILTNHLNPPPIMIVTALAQEDIVARAYDAGASDCITKPISWELFGKKLEFLIANYQRQKWQDNLISNYEAIFNAAANGLCAIDRQQQIMFINPMALEMLQVSRNECIHQDYQQIFRLTSLKDGSDIDCFPFFDQNDATEDTQLIHEAYLYRTDGSKIAVECIVTPVFERFRMIGGVILIQDITEKIERTEQERHAANHDALTLLPNRKFLDEYLPKAVALAERQDRLLALLFIDLDAFKPVNDNYGHKTGDEVLKVIASRLNELLRESDTVCRIGGDEFVIILESANSLEGVRRVAEKVIEEINEPIHACGHICHLGSSIGISLYPDDSKDAATLLQHGDIAMYAAKKGGKNQYKVYDPNQNTVLPRWHKFRHRHQLELLSRIFPRQVRPARR